MLCLRKHLPATLKLVEANDNDLVTELAEQISDEIHETSHKKIESYKLNQFTKVNAVMESSQKLLNFVSQLISKGEITKKSLSLTQTIQAVVSKNFNQTTLGLALTIHNFSGSREIIDILHESGFCSSYDKVRRFRKSEASFTCEKEFQIQRLLDGNGLISAWCDNFDLNVFTPSGMRETHSTAVEFVQHGSGMLMVTEFFDIHLMG